ncbi:AraC family transcriptional regulator [Flavobacterium sp. C4GT6]|uniref:AraC family transcriptional regulator n=1 Tax=Flavobacterium sp. C4GT6 TaxID=3103818 RepID=UPI002ED40EA8
MIKQLHIDKNIHPFGYYAFYVTPQQSEVINHSCRGDFYTMFYVRSGEVVLQIDINKIKIKKGECAFIGINQVFKIENPSTFEVLVLRFEESFYCRHETDINFINNCYFFDNSKKLYKFKLDNATQISIEQDYKNLAEQCTQPYNEIEYMIAHNSIERLLLYCHEKAHSNTPESFNQITNPENELVHNYRQLIKENFKKQKQLKFYTEELNTSVKKLTDACKNIYGQSPKKLITEQTILEAKRLLIHSTMNIKEIAFELNFEEPSNFIRFFSKAVNMSPREYREYSTQKSNLLP